VRDKQTAWKLFQIGRRGEAAAKQEEFLKLDAADTGNLADIRAVLSAAALTSVVLSAGAYPPSNPREETPTPPSAPPSGRRALAGSQEVFVYSP
jgi:hypothetical protein